MMAMMEVEAGLQTGIQRPQSSQMAMLDHRAA
jgi:hypothetical protein